MDPRESKAGTLIFGKLNLGKLKTAGAGWALLCLATWAILAAGCRKEVAKVIDPIAHPEAYDIWRDSIDLHNGLILRVMNDSVAQLRRDGVVLDSITAPALPEGSMRVKTTLPVLDFLYRLEASRRPSATYTAQSPYEAFLNPLQNDSARTALESRLRNSVVVPLDARGLGWPTINSSAEWLLGASELAVAQGDTRWLRQVRQTARLTMENELRVTYDPVTGLFNGIPHYLAVGSGVLPDWMELQDVAGLQTFAVNAAYCGALQSLEGGAGDSGKQWQLSLTSDSLRQCMKRRLWLPNHGCFSAMNYGPKPYVISLTASDNLAQAFAILSGCVAPEFARAIIDKTAVSPRGVSSYQPQLPPASGPLRNEISPLLLQAAWTVAAARTGNESAYSASVGSLFVLTAEELLKNPHRSVSCRSGFTALITRGLLGAQFTHEGMSLSPYVPENLPGEKVISNFRYRDANLSFHITGTGRAISTFTLDGTPSKPFISADLTGNHEIAITLAGASADAGLISLRPEPQMLPLPPTVNWKGRDATIAEGHLPVGVTPDVVREAVGCAPLPNPDNCYIVYVNGVEEEEIFRTDYQLYDAKTLTAVQFCPFTDGEFEGFSGRPKLYIPSGSQWYVYTPTFAKSGARVLENKKIAERFVEMTRYKNRRFPFEFNAPRTGRYLIDVHYAAGLGIVNNQRRIALRILKVNGADAGTFIFTQLSAVTAQLKESDESWQNTVAWTNPLIVQLNEGPNTLELRYFQPSPVFVDPGSNTVLADIVRILPLD